jgi:putative Mg2+ transporter-C (MgtC) family protein
VLTEQLEAAGYPPQDIEIVEREQGGTELVATLLSTAADPKELDAIVERLEANPLVQNAGWSLRTTD